MSEGIFNRTQLTDEWPIDPYSTSGIDLAGILNRLEEAFNTTQFGNSRPATAQPGTLWVSQDGSTGEVTLWLFTGTSDIKVADSDGIGVDEINMAELLLYIEQNIDAVKSWQGIDGSKRKGDVIAQEGDYNVTMMGDYGTADGVYTQNWAIVADGTKFVLQQIANSFTGAQGNKRQGDIVAAEGDYTIELLGDVGLSSLVKDDYLQWNGTSWENNPPKLIETELNFMGGYDITTAPPASPGHGDVYINNNAGNAASGWTGIAGQYVNVGNAVGYSTNHNANGDQVADGTGGAWFLLGEVFTGGITSIGAGSGISVNSDTPSAPVVSVNRTTTDSWYAAKNHTHTEYALAGHDHDGVYAPVNHSHPEYEPVIGPKGSAFNKNFGTTAGTVAEGNHGHSGYALSGHGHTEYALKDHGHNEYEPKFTKNSGFNKNFGTGNDNVARGNHTHDGYATSGHAHSLSAISGGTAKSGSTFVFPERVQANSGLTVAGGEITVSSGYITCSGYIYSGNVLRSAGDVIAYYSSDESLKENIRPIEGALNKVCQIRSIEFEWSDKQEDYEGTDVGVSAQSVQAVFPSLVKEREKDGFLGVRRSARWPDDRCNLRA